MERGKEAIKNGRKNGNKKGTNERKQDTKKRGMAKAASTITEPKKNFVYVGAQRQVVVGSAWGIPI